MMAPLQSLEPEPPKEKELKKLYVISQWIWRVLLIFVMVFEIANYAGRQQDQRERRDYYKTQAEAMRYVIAVTVDQKTIDPETGQPTPWVVEMYRKLDTALQNDQKARDSFTEKAERRVAENSQIADQMKVQFDQFMRDYQAETDQADEDRKSFASEMNAAFEDIKTQLQGVLSNVVSKSQQTLEAARATREDARVTRVHSANVQRRVLQRIPAPAKKTFFGIPIQ